MQAHLHEAQCFIVSTEVRTQQLLMEPEQGIKEAFDLFDNNGPREIDSKELKVAAEKEEVRKEISGCRPR